MSRFDTMASISSWLSAGTTASSACAGVTTPPTVCTASCCTIPSAGAVRACNLVRCSALIRSSASPAALRSASTRSLDSIRRCSPPAWPRVRLGLAIAALMHLALLPLLDQLLAHSQALLDKRDHGVELGDRRRNRRAFGFLLGALAVERSEFGRKLRFLARQELALHRDQIGRCPLGRAKLRDRIGGSTQRGA